MLGIEERGVLKELVNNNKKLGGSYKNNKIRAYSGLTE